MENHINIKPMTDISNSILTECINRTYQKGLISKDKIFLIPELVQISDKVCREIIREDLRNNVSEEDSRLS